MREAFGGTFMIQLLLIFLAIYVAFVAVALNFAKAFRVKNQIIDIIEQNEGIDYTDTSENGTLKKIDNYLGQISYYVSLDNKTNNNEHCYQRGYCIKESDTITVDNISSKYYTVTTYMRVDFPFFKLNFSVPIQGETRKIERVNT